MAYGRNEKGVKKGEWVMIIARRGIVRTIMAFGLMLILVVSMYQMGKTIFGMQESVFSINPFIAPDLQKKMNGVISQLSSFDAQSVQSALLPLYCDIKSIHISRFATKRADIECEISFPLACINEDSVLTESGTVLAKQFFNPLYIKGLPIIFVADVRALTDTAKKWLLQWVPQLHNRYKISFIHEYEIYLNDKKNNFLSVLCAVNSHFDQVTNDRIALMHKKIQEKIGDTSKPKHWIADIRFEKQIILGGAKGGKGYG